MLRSLSATMIYLVGFVGFLLVLTVETRVGPSSELDICSETEECLLFNLTCKNEKFEVRHYESVKWVVTEVSSFSMEIATMKAFRSLYNYIQENQIEMTSPVLVRVPEGVFFWQSASYTMGFLLPSKHQKNPPTSTNDKVRIIEMPEMKVYVKSYGGWIWTHSDKSNAEILSSALDSVNAKYTKAFHYAAGYNSPMKLFGRHNEVWYVVVGEPQCP